MVYQLELAATGYSAAGPSMSGLRKVGLAYCFTFSILTSAVHYERQAVGACCVRSTTRASQSCSQDRVNASDASKVQQAYYSCQEGFDAAYWKMSSAAEIKVNARMSSISLRTMFEQLLCPAGQI